MSWLGSRVAGARRSTGRTARCGIACGAAWARLTDRTVRAGASGASGPDTSSIATLEISGIPARAFKLETRCSQLFAECWFAAGRAVAQGRVREFLQNVLGKPAGRTFIGIDRHGVQTLENCEAFHYKVAAGETSKPSYAASEQADA